MVIREVNGESIEFAKAEESHWEGTECLYLGKAEDGSVKLFESESPDAVLTTTPRKLEIFARAVAAGEFQLS